MDIALNYIDLADGLEEMIAQGWRINKYADPIEGARTNLTIDEARDILDEDPCLIWVELIDPDAAEAAQ